MLVGVSSFSILVRIDLLLGPTSTMTTLIESLFQYPRADRLIVGAQSPSLRLPTQVVSVSSCGSTYCWGWAQVQLLVERVCFSILVRIDLLLGVYPATIREIELVEFQYPRADRLIVGAAPAHGTPAAALCFSILVRIDLLLGPRPVDARPARTGVSVSSCGSTYCWGVERPADSRSARLFQYPRADRLIVGARPVRRRGEV